MTLILTQTVYVIGEIGLLWAEHKVSVHAWEELKMPLHLFCLKMQCEAETLRECTRVPNEEHGKSLKHIKL